MKHNYYLVGTTIDGHEITFDESCVESYISFKNAEGVNCVKLNFKSGKTIDVFSDIDQCVWPGECIETLVDDWIARSVDSWLKPRRRD